MMCKGVNPFLLAEWDRRLLSAAIRRFSWIWPPEPVQWRVTCFWHEAIGINLAVFEKFLPYVHPSPCLQATDDAQLLQSLNAPNSASRIRATLRRPPSHADSAPLRPRNSAMLRRFGQPPSAAHVVRPKK
ncbi:unnamed protein product [Trichogramma brassicae]|uniref:Uncharacterized protein n=1 Tax=Trichogramma brassicae TaxID=86971 RepID=A0A6H5I2M3_9HYME|nr:unnamed protein product [Trichogramma brassicae]